VVDLLAVAQTYAARGWQIFPVAGKLPTTPHGVLDAATDAATLRSWFENPGRATGLALATGTPSGAFVLDLDSEDAVTTIKGLAGTDGVPPTVTAKTKRGYHLLFSMPADGSDVRNSASKIGPGIDVRGTGGYIVLPPSTHPDGGSYRWVNARGPEEVEVAPPPQWLLDRLKVSPAPPNGRVPHNGATPEAGIPAGQRNDVLARLAGTMRSRGMTPAAIEAALLAENGARCSPPLPDDEVRAVAASVSRYTPSAPVESPPAKEPPVPLVAVTVDYLARIGRAKLEPVQAAPTPWPSWNRICCGAGGGEGLARGWHVIVGAGTGSGKSICALNLIAAAIRGGVPSAIITLEMTAAETLTRLLSLYSDTNVRTLEHGSGFSVSAWDDAATTLITAPAACSINAEPVGTMADVIRLLEAAAESGARLAVVDYLQLAWVRSAETMLQQITEVSHAVRSAARRLKMTTVGLSQLNRATTTGGEIRKEGLLGGSSLENDADQVLILGKPERTAPGNLTVTARLDKNRHGPAAEWKVNLDTTTLRMTENITQPAPDWGTPVPA
jgi:KaiC/GvpD/RAD55 family RecA-like ATPase